MTIVCREILACCKQLLAETEAREDHVEQLVRISAPRRLLIPTQHLPRLRPLVPAIDIWQVEERAEELKGIKFDAIYSSDLLRAKQTAEIIKLERDIAIETSKLLKERHFGNFEGASWSELAEKISELDD